MSDFSRANVMRNIQKVQDHLAGLADISLMLLDSQAHELTIPSRLPARCMDFESRPECKQELISLIGAANYEQAHFHRSHCLLHCFSFKTAYRINMQPAYLIGGHVEKLEKMKEHLALFLSIFSLPVSAGLGIGKPSLPGGPGEQELLRSLTPQELKILTLIGEGISNKAIAGQLFISANTVKVHVSRLLHKLKLSNRTDAALFSIRNRLCPDKE